MTDFNEHSTDEDDFVSKTALKREALELQEFASELADMSRKVFDNLPLEPEIRDAINLARRLDNANARKRQMRYIAKMLQKSDLSDTYAALEKQHQQSQQLHSRKAEVENWCKTLLEGDDQFLNQLVEQYPNIDRTHVRQLVRQANKIAQGKKQAPSAQKLFPYLLKQVL